MGAGQCRAHSLGLDSDRKLIIADHVGKRDHINAYEFIGGLNRRIAPGHRFQMATDGLEGYVPAIEEHFRSRCGLCAAH